MKRNFFLILITAFLSVSCTFSNLAGREGRNPEKPWSYSLYEHAGQAIWKTGAGSLTFSGPPDNPDGFVAKTHYGYLNPGVRAVLMLETRPQMISQGWIEGLYPEMTLPENVHLRSYIGFNKGADASDGVTFYVFIHAGNTYSKVAVEKLFPRQYKKIDIDLTPWAGKKVQLILKITAGNNSQADMAIWVNPRLENVDKKSSATGK